jgi:Tfp pilus assembly protein PilF
MKKLKSSIFVFILGLIICLPTYPQTDQVLQINEGFQLLQTEKFAEATVYFGTILKNDPNNFH